MIDDEILSVLFEIFMDKSKQTQLPLQRKSVEQNWGTYNSITERKPALL